MPVGIPASHVQVSGIQLWLSPQLTAGEATADGSRIWAAATQLGDLIEFKTPGFSLIPPFSVLGN